MKSRWLALLLALALAAPAAAYTIYLRDGSKLVAREKYRVEGDRAYIVLVNGTETFIKAAEIDVERTDGANQADYGDALVLEGGQVTQLENAQPGPQRDTLADLIARGEAAPRTRPEVRRVKPGAAGAEPAGARSLAGFSDFSLQDRRPAADPAAAEALRHLFAENGLADVQVWAGSSADRPRLEVVTDTEAAIFRALLTASLALDQQREAGGGPAALELLLLTAQGGRAGQFVLTAEQARQLVSQQVEVTRFFVENVQF